MRFAGLRIDLDVNYRHFNLLWFTIRMMHATRCPSRATSAPAPARMIILVLPTRMILVRVQAPAKHEVLAVLVALLLGLHSLPDHRGQSAIGFIAAFVRRLAVFGVCLDAWQRHSSLP